MKTLDHSINRAISEYGTDTGTKACPHWQMAGDRVLLYLNCLNFPMPHALELALGALKAAEQRINLGSETSPVAESMKALHRLLNEQKHGTNGKSQSLSGWHDRLPTSTPPLHRRPMVPEEMAIADLRSLLRSILRSKRKPSQREALIK